jgi:hypothetical protein
LVRRSSLAHIPGVPFHGCGKRSSTARHEAGENRRVEFRSGTAPWLPSRAVGAESYAPAQLTAHSRCACTARGRRPAWAVVGGCVGGRTPLCPCLGHEKKLREGESADQAGRLALLPGVPPSMGRATPTTKLAPGLHSQSMGGGDFVSSAEHGRGGPHDRRPGG